MWRLMSCSDPTSHSLRPHLGDIMPHRLLNSSLFLWGQYHCGLCKSFHQGCIVGAKEVLLKTKITNGPLYCTSAVPLNVLHFPWWHYVFPVKVALSPYPSKARTHSREQTAQCCNTIRYWDKSQNPPFCSCRILSGSPWKQNMSSWIPERTRENMHPHNPPWKNLK